MNVLELRIGNTVKTDVDNLHKITIEDLQFLLDDPLDDFYQEIVLTDDILLERGFIQNDNIRNKEFIIECDGAWLLLEKDLSKKNLTYVIWHSLNSKEDFQPLAFYQYLHQLENLYFALKGTELEVTL